MRGRWGSRGLGDSMKTKPILFNGEMVRALLAKRKGQTRRPVTGTALKWLEETGFKPGFVAAPENGLSPFGYVGDYLYVRETWHQNHTGELIHYRADWPADNDPFSDCYFGEDCDLVGEKWRPSIHMPRKASRLTLRIRDVRIERASEISSEDAKQEGIQLDEDLQGWHLEDGRFFHGARAEDSFRQLWSALYPDRDWCWVVSFEVIDSNVDQVLSEVSGHESF